MCTVLPSDERVEPIGGGLRATRTTCGQDRTHFFYGSLPRPCMPYRIPSSRKSHRFIKRTPTATLSLDRVGIGRTGQSSTGYLPRGTWFDGIVVGDSSNPIHTVGKPSLPRLFPVPHRQRNSNDRRQPPPSPSSQSSPSPRT